MYDHINVGDLIKIISYSKKNIYENDIFIVIEKDIYQGFAELLNCSFVLLNQYGNLRWVNLNPNNPYHIKEIVHVYDHM